MLVVRVVRTEVGLKGEIDTAIVGHDSVSFPVVDRLEAKSNDRPGPKTCDLPDTDKTRRGNTRHSPDQPTESQLTGNRNLSCRLFLRPNLHLPCSLLLSPMLIPLTFLSEGNSKNVRPEGSAASSLQAFHESRYLIVLSA